MAVNKMNSVKIGAENNILFATSPSLAVGVVVNQNVGTSVGAKKIAKAGTPLTGDLSARSTPFTAATEGNAIGVLLHDVDLTKGDNNATLLIHGFVDLNKVDGTTASLLTEGVKTGLKGLVTFLK